MLFNVNNFKDYFRGIYFKTEPINGKGNYFLFNRASAQVQLFYTYAVSDTSNTKISSSIVFPLGPAGSQLATIGYTNTFKPEIVSALSERDTVNGDMNLYLKGGQGSMTVIDLFGPDEDADGVPDELAALRKNKNRIVRDASLVFHINKEKINQISGVSYNSPARLYIYDLETNGILFDYSADAQFNSSGQIVTLGNTHLGILQDADTNDPTYRIRITQYVKNLLNTTTTNTHTKLGVVVTQNPLYTITGLIEGAMGASVPTRIPFASVLSQEGTILYGSNAEVPDDKRLSLELFFTETSN